MFLIYIIIRRCPSLDTTLVEILSGDIFFFKNQNYVKKHKKLYKHNNLWYNIQIERGYLNKKRKKYMKKIKKTLANLNKIIYHYVNYSYKYKQKIKS